MPTGYSPAPSAGTVTVTATAADGTGIYGSKNVTVDEIGCTVTFNSQGGSVVAPVNTPINTTIAAPTPAADQNRLYVWRLVQGASLHERLELRQ